MVKIYSKKLTGLMVLALMLSACASKPSSSPSEAVPAPVAVHTPEELRINELERLLADKQRQCAEEKRRQDSSLKESQKKVDELQKKLNNLLAIDRELRRSKAR
jgi:TolA-binding protein